MSWLESLQIAGDASSDEIYEAVKRVMQAEFNFSDDELGPDSHLIEDLDFDSIDAIDLAVRVEEITGIEIAEDDLKSLTRVSDIVRLIETSFQKTPPAA